MTKRGIFDYNISGDRGLSSYERDLVSVLIVDDDFFEKSINSIDQNTFQFESFRLIVGLLKDAWQQNGIHLHPDTIMKWSELKFGSSPIDIEEIRETLNICQDVDENRAKEIKETFIYRNLFYYLAYAVNHAKDSMYADAITNFGKLKKVAETLITDAEKVKAALDTIEEVGKGGRNDWD